MDIAEKLTVLADAAKYDASCSSSGSKKTRPGAGIGSTEGSGICHSYTPDGRCVSLLKILLTNNCIFDCAYCINRVSSDVRRARFTVKEVVDLTLDFYRRNYIEGLFLSSGIIRSSDYTMEQVIEVARCLREDHGYRGYIHLKTIPGAADELVQQAGLFADRLSVNIELPTAADLQQLAPEKNRPQLENNMAQIEVKTREIKADRKNGLKSAPFYAPAGQSTQMIIGATPTSDRDVLLTAATLYKQYRLKRVYYSAFSPIPHASARLPGHSPPLLREHRLYQADWLQRFYQYDVGEITPAAQPDLDIDLDPKTAWALRNPAYFPVDVNKAPREKLLRIPGIGVGSVNAILRIRRYATIGVRDLLTLKVAFNRAKHFLIAGDHRPFTLTQAQVAAALRPPASQLALPL